MMKTIGYVLAEFPVLSETFIGNEMRAMQHLKHKIIPIAFMRPSGAYQPDDQLLANAARYLSMSSMAEMVALCLRHPVGFFRALQCAQTQTGMSARSALASAAKIAVQAKKQNCQHLHAHFALHSAAGALMAARWLNISVSFVGHGYDIYATPSDLTFKLTQADFAVAVCQQMKQDFQHLAPTADVLLLECGIALDKFQFEPQVTPSKSLLFIGRLAEKKGLPHLLQALALIPKAQRPKLDIIGDGALKSEIEQQIIAADLTADVQLLGPKTSDWIRQHAASYLGLVAPFQIAANGDRDTGPLVLKEAMAMGIPVICSSLMGCIEIVDADTGFLVPPANPAALALAIQQLMALNSSQRQTLTYKARRKVEKLFNVNILCQRLSLKIESLP
jgi:colanic acid/amylovoran biosynthesis glycosyltransferase